MLLTDLSYCDVIDKEHKLKRTLMEATPTSTAGSQKVVKNVTYYGSITNTCTGLTDNL